MSKASAQGGRLKARYRTRNWREYDRGLIARGDPTVWISPELARHAAGGTGRRGRPLVFTDAAIQAVLTLKVLYQLPLRAAQGMAGSPIRLAGLDWRAPHYSTGCGALAMPAMSDNLDAGRAPPRLWWDPLGFWSGRLAPNELNQPILPGWVFAGAVTVNERNSSAPETEREIVAAESYGRQIGRISDALAVLIAEWPEGKLKPEAIREFEALRARVDRIKGDVAAKRAERFLDDMILLRRDNPEEFRRLADRVRRLEAEGAPVQTRATTSRGGGKGRTA